jgi:hypothetical protein
MTGVSGRPTGGAHHHCGFILHNLYKEHIKIYNKYVLQSAKTRIVELLVFQTMVINFDRQTVIGVLNTATVGNISVRNEVQGTG